MVSVDRHDGRADFELEKPFDARAVFFPTLHDPYNLSEIKPLIGEFERELKKSKGRNVIYLESSDFEKKHVQVFKEISEKEGFLAPVLIMSFLDEGERLTSENIQAIRHKISVVGWDWAIKQISSSNPNLISLLQELDKLRALFKFDVEFEAHDIKTIEEIKNIAYEAEILGKEIESIWKDGDFNMIAEKEKKMLEVMRQQRACRHKDVKPHLKRIIKDLALEKNNGVVFIVFGANHYSAVGEIERDLNDKRVDFKIAENGRGKIPGEQIEDKVLKGVPLSKEDYARNVLFKFIKIELERYVISKKRMDLYMNKYNDVISIISQIVNEFSLEDVEKIVKERIDLLDLLRNHPKGAGLLPFISRLHLL